MSSPLTRACAVVVAAMTGAALLASCSPPPEALPAAIECGYLYRPDGGSAAGEDGGTLTAAQGTQETVDFETMSLLVAYDAGQPDGNAVRIATSTADGRSVSTNLYQYDTSAAPLLGEFAGGHGFTGLIYSHHDDAVLQVHCTASDG